MNDHLDGRIREILAPLDHLTPATRGDSNRLRRRERVLVAVAIVLVLVVGLAATWAALDLTASPKATPVSPGGGLACLNIVGGRADDAEDVLARKGYAISWRQLTYQPPTGQMFTTTAPDAVPDTAVVEDVETEGDSRVLVFVHDRDDPYAPKVDPLAC
jgi:hypothetical protein